MKKSELESFIREEILSILSEESTEEKIDQTKELTQAMNDLAAAKEKAGLEEEEEPTQSDLKKSAGVINADVKDRYVELSREMKSLGKAFAESEDEEERNKLLQILSKKTAIKKELEAKLGF